MISDWEVLGAVEPRRLTEARLQLHHAVQAIPSFAQALVPARDDDSHRAMTWDASRRAFLSEPAAGDTFLRVCLAPGSLELSVSGRDRPTRTRALLGGTLRDTHTWLERELRGMPGIAEDLRLAEPDYDLPDHAVADGATLDAGSEGGAFEELARWYANAAAMLERLRKVEPHATAVRCWPHHFDIASLVVLDPDIGASTGRSVGVGFSPGDEGYPLPYWYVTPYPYPGTPELVPLPSGGVWHTEGWFGAVLTGDRIVRSRDPEVQSGAVSEFLESAVRTSKSLLAD